MDIKLRLTTLFLGGLFAFLSVYLLVLKKNNERNTILWLGASWLALVLAAFPGFLNAFAHWLGVYYPPSLLFLLAIIALLFIVLYQSIQISALNFKIKELGQEIAFIRYSPPGDRTGTKPATSRPSGRPVDSMRPRGE